MNGQTIIVTGASDGIGRALAAGLAARGARIVLAARNEAALEAAARECRRAGGDALAVRTDVGVPAECRALVDRAAAWSGRIDGLVNNAALSFRGRLDEVADVELFERVMRVNYLSAVCCTHAALPHLKAARGLVVAISSVQGLAGFPSYSGYAASKHALQGFFDSIRIELRATGVDVLVVSPGAVATAIGAHGLGPDGRPRGERPRSAAMPVAECVRQILDAMARRDRELVMTATARRTRWLRLLAPEWVDRRIERGVEAFLRAHQPGYGDAS